MQKVIKRDGKEVVFDIDRIVNAVKAASKASGEDVDWYGVAVQVSERIASKTVSGPTGVEEIQDLVIYQLSKNGYQKTSDAYSKYRQDRSLARESNSELTKKLMGLITKEDSDICHDNANKDSLVVSTARDLIAGVISKHYFVQHVMAVSVRDAVNKGFIYQHDADYGLTPLTNCCLINYPDMLANGFRIGDASIEMPHSIGVATTVATQIVQGVASSQYGGSTLCEIDRYLAPYVKLSKDKLIKEQKAYQLPDEWVEHRLEKEVYDAMQTLLYQVNTLHTVNGQSPFVTISLGHDTTEFGRMITREYLKVHMNGLGKDHTTPVFPKVIFLLEEGFNMNPGDPNYDLKQLAMQCSAKRIYPDYISAPLNRKVTHAKKEIVTSMGCRSFLSYWNNPATGKEEYLGRANLGVVSVVLPIIAKWARTHGLDFFETLDYYCEIAYKAHMDRINRLAKTKAKENPLMFMEGALARLGPDEEIGQLFKGGRFSASLGFIGVAETCEILYGNIDKDSALRIVEFLKDKCDEWKDRSGIAFSVYGTPAESMCYKNVVSYNKLFPDDPWPRDYFTNSFHQPVWIKSTPIEKWEYEEGFAYLSSGGNIGYVETPNLERNPKALEALIDYGYKHIPYFGINQPVDHCFKCGFEGEFTADADGYHCPDCNNSEEGTISVIRRVSGYLGAPNSRPYNKGKQQEVVDRVKHC